MLLSILHQLVLLHGHVIDTGHDEPAACSSVLQRALQVNANFVECAFDWNQGVCCSQIRIPQSWH